MGAVVISMQASTYQSEAEGDLHDSHMGMETIETEQDNATRYSKFKKKPGPRNKKIWGFWHRRMVYPTLNTVFLPARALCTFRSLQKAQGVAIAFFKTFFFQRSHFPQLRYIIFVCKLWFMCNSKSRPEN